MAVERVWFPHAPDGSVDADDRSREGIGYGGITISAAVAALGWVRRSVAALTTWTRVSDAEFGE